MGLAKNEHGAPWPGCTMPDKGPVYNKLTRHEPAILSNLIKPRGLDELQTGAHDMVTW